MLNIKGNHFDCDAPAPHKGWAHSNKESGAIWIDDRNQTPYRPTVGEKIWWYLLRKGLSVRNSLQRTGDLVGRSTEHAPLAGPITGKWSTADYAADYLNQRRDEFKRNASSPPDDDPPPDASSPARIR